MITADDDTGGDGVGSWDAIAVQSPDGTDLAIVDAAGEELDRFDLDDGGPMDSSGPYVLVGPTDPEVIDTRSGDRMTIELDADGAFAQFLAPPSPIVAVHSTEGANVRLFDPDSGTETDVAAIGDLTDPAIILQGALFDAEAGVLGLFDHSTSQSLLVEVHGEDEPVFLAGRVVDVAFGSALAVQPARRKTELRFYDLEGEELATINVPELRAAWLTDRSTALVVTDSGELLRLTVDGDESDQLATLDIDETDPRAALLLRRARRLAYETTDGRVSIVDWEGTEIAEAPGELVVTHMANRMAQRCVAVSAEQDDDTQLSQTRLLDTKSGDPVGQAFELHSSISSTSGDGCTVSTMEGQTPVVVHRDHTTELESRPALVSPDGESVIVSSGGQNRLQRAGDEDDDPIELPDGGVAFINRS